MTNPNVAALRRIMEQEGLSPSGFARKLGISRAHMSRIMKGQRRPGAEFIVALLRAYPDKKFEDFFWSERNP